MEDILENERAGRGDGTIVNLLTMEREYRAMGKAWSERADILLDAALRLKQNQSN